MLNKGNESINKKCLYYEQKSSKIRAQVQPQNKISYWHSIAMNLALNFKCIQVFCILQYSLFIFHIHSILLLIFSTVSPEKQNYFMADQLYGRNACGKKMFTARMLMVEMPRPRAAWFWVWLLHSSLLVSSWQKRFKTEHITRGW